MQFDSKKLIQDLTERTMRTMAQCDKLRLMATEDLSWKPHTNGWSVLECIEHLNLYGDFYIPEMEKCLSNSKTVSSEVFKSGWLGNYFAKSMLPKEKLNKMKTFKDKNPIGNELDVGVLDRFMSQQSNLLEILESAQNVNLNKVKTAISISKWIRLRLGDTLRVVIYHNDRHMTQINKLLATMKKLA